MPECLRMPETTAATTILPRSFSVYIALKGKALENKHLLEQDGDGDSQLRKS
jgi:hypothetical protein